jgi:hypothetical protein
MSPKNFISATANSSFTSPRIIFSVKYQFQLYGGGGGGGGCGCGRGCGRGGGCGCGCGCGLGCSTRGGPGTAIKRLSDSQLVKKKPDIANRMAKKATFFIFIITPIHKDL